MAKIHKIKVLIADDDGQLSRRLANYLNERGFDCRTAASGDDARSIVLDWQPRLVMADLMLPEFNALELLDFINKHPKIGPHRTQLIVTSGHNDTFNVQQAVQRGAKDYLVKPFSLEDALRRIVFHCRTYRHLSDLNRKDFGRADEGSLMLHLTDLVLRQAIAPDSLETKLYNLTRMVAMKVDGVRCSIIHAYEPTRGIVVTSSDDKGATGIELDLNKYPEVTNVMLTGVMIAIENIDDTSELKHVRTLLKDITFNSMIVCPISRGRDRFGVLSLRMPPTKVAISDNEMRFCEIVAHVASLVLTNENAKKIDEFWWHSLRQPTVLPFPSKGKK